MLPGTDRDCIAVLIERVVVPAGAGDKGREQVRGA